jgi:hypothetical protein
MKENKISIVGNAGFIGLILILVSTLASAISYEPGITWTVDNETYGISVPMSFDNWSFISHGINFNGLNFNLTSSNNIFINYSYFRSHPKSTIPGQNILNLNASATTGTAVTFNISGLQPSHSYIIINDTTPITRITSATGSLQWNHNTWSTNQFRLYDGYIGNPTVSSETPTDHATGITLSPTCSIILTDPSGTQMTVRFYEDTTGVMVLRQTNTSIASGTTVRWTYTQANTYTTSYNWRVSINTSTTPNTWTNETYSFTTIPSYDSPGTTNIVEIAIPAIIALTLIVVLLAMLYTGTLTIESFVTWLILFFIAMIAIFTIFGISI